MGLNEMCVFPIVDELGEGRYETIDSRSGGGGARERMDGDGDDMGLGGAVDLAFRGEVNSDLMPPPLAVLV